MKKLLIISSFLLMASIAYATLSISDNFDDNSLNATLWGTYTSNGSVTETSQQLHNGITANTSNAEALTYSKSLYNLTGSDAYVNLVQAASPGVDTMFGLQNGSSNYGSRMMWLCTPTTCYTYIQLAYANKCTGVDAECSSVSITPGANTYLRIREASGTTYFDYSTNAQSSWTNSYSTSTSALPYAVTSMEVLFDVYEWSSSGGTTNNASYYDNFDIPITAGSVYTNSPQGNWFRE